ncbi:EAL domain-containing protein [Mastigocladus laminosus UU774]|nr:EAL domain-containing protein [Mastigocladus laminosus UU774]
MSEKLKKTILILAANPKNTTQLRLAEEVRDIEEALKRSENRNQFNLETRWAVRPRDLVRAMTEVEPNIVHFCGHGKAEEGIALEDNQGNVQLISIDGLANLFKSFNTQVECVLLNACYSKIQVEVISQYIDYVIGMEQEIQDRDAIEFAVSFYDALGSGKTYESAYMLGCITMQLYGAAENLMPSCKRKQGGYLTFQDESENIVQSVTQEPYRERGIYFKPVTSILEKYDRFIEDFIEIINFDNCSETMITDAIRNFFDAKLVYIYKYGRDRVLYESKSTDLAVEVCSNTFNSLLKNRYSKALKAESPYRIYIEKEPDFTEEGYLITIPNKNSNSIIVIFGLSTQLESLEDIIGTMLSSLYDSEEEYQKLKTKEHIKYRMYDAVKRQYNHVSDAVYEERFKGFHESLQKIEVLFEPIIFFDRHDENMTIAGWEALARDPETGRAPVNLFKIAEMWGVRFQTEIDLYILEKALRTYKQATEKSRTERYDEKKMLSINVYPSSILRTAYENLLSKLVRGNQKLLSGKKLMLEISEKTLLPEIINNEGKGLESFKSIARKYRKNYDVKFAVDDFGVGNASVSRLEEVDPTYVKVDREILHFEKRLGRSIIEYLVDLKYDFNCFTIIEGFDEYSKFSLQELVVELGVEYIQGHSLGMATSEIKGRLDKEKYQSIFEQLKWRTK